MTAGEGVGVYTPLSGHSPTGCRYTCPGPQNLVGRLYLCPVTCSTQRYIIHTTCFVSRIVSRVAAAFGRGLWPLCQQHVIRNLRTRHARPRWELPVCVRFAHHTVTRNGTRDTATPRRRHGHLPVRASCGHAMHIGSHKSREAAF